MLKKGSECFESLRMNGIFSTISNFFPFVPSLGSGRALSSSKDSERVFQQLVFQVLCLAFFRATRNLEPETANPFVRLLTRNVPFSYLSGIH